MIALCCFQGPPRRGCLPLSIHQPQPDGRDVVLTDHIQLLGPDRSSSLQQHPQETMQHPIYHSGETATSPVPALPKGKEKVPSAGRTSGTTAGSTATLSWTPSIGPSQSLNRCLPSSVSPGSGPAHISLHNSPGPCMGETSARRSIWKRTNHVRYLA